MLYGLRQFAGHIHSTKELSWNGQLTGTDYVIHEKVETVCTRRKVVRIAGDAYIFFCLY
ncbi:MAG: hypothetical protein J1E98_14315 [Lachnospiraceae bacterium]|nr:hypothetical protein [Lachnospiraceae bacterium]